MAECAHIMYESILSTSGQKKWLTTPYYDRNKDVWPPKHSASVIQTQVYLEKWQLACRDISKGHKRIYTQKFNLTTDGEYVANLLNVNMLV